MKDLGRLAACLMVCLVVSLTGFTAVSQAQVCGPGGCGSSGFGSFGSRRAAVRVASAGEHESGKVRSLVTLPVKLPVKAVKKVLHR